MLIINSMGNIKKINNINLVPKCTVAAILEPQEDIVLLTEKIRKKSLAPIFRIKTGRQVIETCDLIQQFPKASLWQHLCSCVDIELISTISNEKP